MTLKVGDWVYFNPRYTKGYSIPISTERGVVVEILPQNEVVVDWEAGDREVESASCMLLV